MAMINSTRSNKTLRSFVCVLLSGVLIAALVFSLTGCSTPSASGSASGSAGDSSKQSSSTSADSASSASSADSTSSSDQSGAEQSSSGQPTNPGKPVAVKEGMTAPDFEFVMMDGTTAKLSDYRGQVILLNFWATWCGYCIQEMPDMQKIAENYPDVVILAVNRSDVTADAIAFANKADYDFTWALDEDGSIEFLYPAIGIPYTVVIDKNGVIGTIYTGRVNYSYFESALLAAGATK